MQPYEKLLAWRASDRLAHAVYDLTSNWPRDEQYHLTQQIRRAAVSAAANIAEGSARKGSAEFHRFLQVAFASLTEVGYLLAFAKQRGYLTDEQFRVIRGKREDAARLTFLLLTRLRQ